MKNFLLAFVLFLSACSLDKTSNFISTSPASPLPSRLTSISIESQLSPENQYVGQTVQLKAVGKDQFGNALPAVAVDWSSSDPSIASVSQTGLVKINTIGIITIVATRDSVQGKYNITVANAPLKSLQITSTDNLYVGRYVNLTITGIDALNNNRYIDPASVTCNTTTPNIVTVGKDSFNNIFVSGYATGTAVVNCTSNNVSSFVVINVRYVPVSYVVFSPNTSLIRVGETKEAVFYLYDKDNRLVTNKELGMRVVGLDNRYVDKISVNQANKTYTGKSAGQAYLTVIIRDEFNVIQFFENSKLDITIK